MPMFSKWSVSFRCPCMKFSLINATYFLHFILHDLILTYLVRSTHHQAPCNADFSSHLLLHQIHPLLTNWRTPCSRVLLEKLTGFQPVKKFPAFYGIWRFITTLTRACHLSLSWARSIHIIPLHLTSWRSFITLSPYLPLDLLSGLFPSGFPTKTLPMHPYNPKAELCFCTLYLCAFTWPWEGMYSVLKQMFPELISYNLICYYPSKIFELCHTSKEECGKVHVNWVPVTLA